MLDELSPGSGFQSAMISVQRMFFRIHVKRAPDKWQRIYLISLSDHQSWIVRWSRVEKSQTSWPLVSWSMSKGKLKTMKLFPHEYLVSLPIHMWWKTFTILVEGQLGVYVWICVFILGFLDRTAKIVRCRWNLNPARLTHQPIIVVTFIQSNLRGQWDAHIKNWFA